MSAESDGSWSMSALLGALSLSTDAANGVRPQTALRTAVLSAELARAAGLSATVVRAAYWAAMLRFLGCTSFAHETARVAAGDDRAMLASLQTADTASASSVLRHALDATRGRGAMERFASVAKLVGDPALGASLASAHCAQAVSLAALLDAGRDVCDALADLYERWDGLGNPGHKRGDALSHAARVVHVAGWAEAHDAVAGSAHAIEAVRAMAGRSLDPALATLFAKHGGEWLRSVERRAYERAIEREPEPRWMCDSSRQEAVFLAFARYADLKSPFTLSHSTQVAALLDRAAVAMGLEERERTLARRAALVHDVGRVAISNGIWDTAEPLGAFDREQIRSHSAHTERALTLFDGTRAMAELASSAHERQDESGYPHGKAPKTVAAKLLAACDVASALRETRPYRAAKSLTECVDTLGEEAKLRRLDQGAVDCVIAVLRGRKIERPAHAALSERELSVLALLAQGASNKEIAVSLGISAKTVQHHVAHVYDKTGVRSRAAAALYAVERGLLAPRGS